MRVTVTIADDIVKHLKKYTNSTTVNESVNIAIKDWLVIYKMREFNKRMSKRSMYANNTYYGSEDRLVNMS